VHLIHIRLDLEDKSGKRFFHGIDPSRIRRPCKRRHSHLKEIVQEDLHAEIRQRRAEKYMAQFSVCNPLLIKLRACAVQKFDLVEEGLFCILPDEIRQFRIIQIDLRRDSFLCPFLGIRIGDHVMPVAVINPAESLSGSDRPVDRAGRDSEFFFNVVQKIKAVFRVPVEFIDKGKNRNMPHDTDLEQLPRLRLHAFAGVYHHDCRIRSHQSAVSVFREILMARRIKNIDAVSAIVELQHGTGHRDTSLLLDLHPVRNSVSGRRLAFYRSGKINGSAVQQKFLSQSRLAGVRMRNNRKGSSFFNLRPQITHLKFPVFSNNPFISMLQAILAILGYTVNSAKKKGHRSALTRNRCPHR
jgi:hypothetical protein